MSTANLRASDADRNRALQRLHAACAAGALGCDELDERIDAALRASRVSDLDALVADLPAPPATPAPARPTPLARFAGVLALVNLACLGIWLAAGAHGSFWPKWVLPISAVRLAAYAWHLRAGEPDAAEAVPWWPLGRVGQALHHLPRRVGADAPDPTARRAT